MRQFPDPDASSRARSIAEAEVSTASKPALDRRLVAT
jgi:hypothetical protein